MNIGRQPPASSRRRPFSVCYYRVELLPCEDGQEVGLEFEIFGPRNRMYMVNERAQNRSNETARTYVVSWICMSTFLNIFPKIRYSSHHARLEQIIVSQRYLCADDGCHRQIQILTSCRDSFWARARTRQDSSPNFASRAVTSDRG